MEPFALILAAVLAQTEAGSASPPPMPRAATVDANRDGVVTREEWMGNFDRMDTDHDGRLTREERRAGRMPYGNGRGRDDGDPGDRRGPPPREDGPPRETTRAQYLARAAERFDRLDANHDGRIDPAEMGAARPRWARPDAADDQR